MAKEETTTCCVAGGGPAGMMLAYLLARQGVSVLVLEKHKDFLRDFRGDTIHPSTLQVMHELGILEDFLKLPHQQLKSIGARFGDFSFRAANFRYVPTECQFIALMPQWDFLDFLAGQAAKYPTFQLRRNYQVTGLLRDGDRVTGVEARTPEGDVRIRADLVVGCDGRHAITREAAQLPLEEFGVPIDVLWFRIPRAQEDPEYSLGNINFGKGLVLINRGDYFQAGLIIAKGSFEEMKQMGLAGFHKTVGQVAPFLRDRLSDLDDWGKISLLSVQINRLQRWHRPGLLCIGDAAHAMSPAGGVGINLAIQDAVAAANILAQPLLQRRATEGVLEQVQRRRMFPARVTQRFQVAAHRGLQTVFQKTGPMRAPWQLKALVSIPGVQDVMGRAIGMGVRPEHVARTGTRLLARRSPASIAVGCAALFAATAFAILKSRRTALRRSC